MDSASWQERRFALVYPVAVRVRAVVGALAMWLIAVAWGALMLHVGLGRPATPPSGRPVALALILLAVPFLAWGFGYWRRVIAAAPELVVRGSQLTILHPLLLRSPLVLTHEELAGVAVDGKGARSMSDELRFPVLGVKPEDVVHPGPLGGWLVSKPPVPRRTPDEAAR
jgi:hypothetical protein